MPCPITSAPSEASLASLSELVTPKQLFFRPSPLLRRLLLLLNLKGNGVQPQTLLAKHCVMSPAMTNKYIEVFRQEKLIQVEPLDGKSLRYDLTDEGIQLSMDLLDMCSAEVVRFYAGVRNLVCSVVMQCAASGLHRLALFGASATGELVMAATRDMATPVVVGVADSELAKQGQMFCGLRIHPPQALANMECDAVVVASWGQKKNMCAMLQGLGIQHKVVTL